MVTYKSIGFTKKTYGIKGEVKLKIPDQHLEDLAQAEVLFLGISGRKIPCFIEYINFENPFTIKFEDYNSKEVAVELTGKEIFMRSTDLLPLEEKIIEPKHNLFYEKYIDYLVLDETAGAIGKIDEIIEYPQQEMASITFKAKKVLIPLNEALIIDIINDDKVIKMDLPTGILELE